MELRSLSDEVLERNLKGFVARERQLLPVILAHIQEVDRRRLYLDRGYPSLYEYLIKECLYSAAAAMRRLEAARLMAQVPEASAALQEGRLNLSQLGEVARALNARQRATGERIPIETKRRLLIKIQGQNLRETQVLVAADLELPLREDERLRFQRDGSVHLELTFSQEQYELLLRGRDLLSRKNAGRWLNLGTWAGFFEVMSRQILKDSERAHRESTRVLKQNPIHVPPRVRADLLREGSCQYQDPRTGRVCGSTFGLQIDHRVPRWAGGLSGRENLQVLCAAHNQHRYRVEAGLRLH